MTTQNTTTSRRRSRRYLAHAQRIDRAKQYPIPAALDLLRQISTVRFDPTIELHITAKGKIRQTIDLPHGIGKKQAVLVFATGKAAEAAKAAASPTGRQGSTRIGGKELVEAIKKDKTVHADLVLSTKDMMPHVVKIASILGPKGLMPNPKLGTITENPAERITARASGQIEIKSETKTPLIHLAIGKLSMSTKDIQDNIQAVFNALAGKVTKATLSSTMSPGIKLQL